MLGGLYDWMRVQYIFFKTAPIDPSSSPSFEREDARAVWSVPQKCGTKKRRVRVFVVYWYVSTASTFSIEYHHAAWSSAPPGRAICKSQSKAPRGAHYFFLWVKILSRFVKRQTVCTIFVARQPCSFMV